MSEEIDDYLLKKLKYIVDGAEDQSLLSKLVHLHEHFKRLKDLLELPGSPNPCISEEEWPKIRRENLYYLNDLLTERQTLTKKRGIYTPESIISAYNLSKNLSKLTKDLRGGDGYAFTHFPKPRDEASPLKKASETTYLSSSLFIDPDKVHGLDAKAMSLERALVGTRREASNSFKAIGIVGMPGIGKTTLAQLIFSRDKVKDYFLLRIWVCMSKQPIQEDTYDTKEIVKRILRSVGIEEEVIMMIYEKRKVQGLIFALRAQLMDKRYLIVLDDVEEEFGRLDSSGSLVQNGEVMKQLEYGLPKGCGGTVIVTSRNEEVAKEMVGEANLHTLVPLSDPDSCWLIFKDWVEKDNTKFPPNLVASKEEIVRKCGGLPLSAKLMGQIVNQRLNQPRLPRANPQERQQPPEENQQPHGAAEDGDSATNRAADDGESAADGGDTDGYQKAEDQQPIEKLQMENQELTEQLENQQLTELKTEIQQPIETEEQQTKE